MLQNAKVTAFTASELLREKQQRCKITPPPPPPPHTHRHTHTPRLGLTIVARVAEKKLKKKGSKVEFPIKTSAKYVL